MASVSQRVWVSALSGRVRKVTVTLSENCRSFTIMSVPLMWFSKAPAVGVREGDGVFFVRGVADEVGFFDGVGEGLGVGPGEAAGA